MKNKIDYLYKGTLFLYLLVLVRVIVFKHPIPVMRGIMDSWDVDMVKRGVYTANLVPFKTIKMYINYYHEINGFDNLFGNICAFMPFGVLVPMAYEKCKRAWKVFIHSLWLSLGIEVFQLISHFGEFDVDDIILNCFGAMLGYYVFFVFYKIFHRKNTK